MKNDCLVDTNVLVYAYDNSDPDRQSIAERLLDRLVAGDRGILTAQVLAEFYVVTTTRIRDVLSREDAATVLLELASTFRIHDLTASVVMEAARGASQHGLSYWDAQIWASAKLNQIPVVLTEDIPSASIVEGVRYVNPFSPDEQTTLALLGLAD